MQDIRETAAGVRAQALLDELLDKHLDAGHSDAKPAFRESALLCVAKAILDIEQACASDEKILMARFVRINRESNTGQLIDVYNPLTRKHSQSIALTMLLDEAASLTGMKPPLPA